MTGRDRPADPRREALALLDNLHRRGVTLTTAPGGCIDWTTPPGVMTEADLVEIRRLKPHVRRELLMAELVNFAADMADRPRVKVEPEPPAFDAPARASLLRTAKARGCPSIAFRSGERVHARREAWRTFCRHANMRDLHAAADALDVKTASTSATSLEAAA